MAGYTEFPDIIIENAKYIKGILSDENETVICTIDGQEVQVPMNSNNSQYIEILKQVDAGTITIEEAD